MFLLTLWLNYFDICPYLNKDSQQLITVHLCHHKLTHYKTVITILLNVEIECAQIQTAFTNK